MVVSLMRDLLCRTGYFRGQRKSRFVLRFWFIYEPEHDCMQRARTYTLPSPHSLRGYNPSPTGGRHAGPRGENGGHQEDHSGGGASFLGRCMVP